MFDSCNVNVNLTDTCRGCLCAGENVREMSDDEKDWYRCYLVKTPATYNSMQLCYVCAYLLRKLQRFVNQCIRANNMLENVLAQHINSRLQNQNIQPIFKLMRTQVQHVDFVDNNANCNSFMFDDMYVDEEDVPLVMLKSEDVADGEDVVVRNSKKKRKKWKRERNEKKESKKSTKLEKNITDLVINDTCNAVVKLEKVGIGKLEIDENELGRKKNSKKILREGFTSRMVQETDVYRVIKLTKEQVLQEMVAKSKSEEYAKFLYKCDQCVKGFNFEDVLTTHMDKHAAKKGWLVCDICNQFCPSVVSLRGHLKSHTTRYECKVCHCVRLSRQVLLEHHAAAHTATEISYSCRYCEFVSTKRTSMQRHVRTVHNASERRACDQCGKMFNSLEALRVHSARHDKSKCVSCDECKRSFIYPSLLARHKAAVHERDDYYCVECDLKFSSRTNLTLHFKRAKKHRDISAYKFECEQCSQRFLYRSTLSAHLASAHGTEKRHTCESCSRRYSSRDALRSHVRQAHSAACAHCDRSIARRSRASDRPYTCACGAVYASDTLGVGDLKLQKQDEVIDLQPVHQITENNVQVETNS